MSLQSFNKAINELHSLDAPDTGEVVSDPFIITFDKNEITTHVKKQLIGLAKSHDVKLRDIESGEILFSLEDVDGIKVTDS